MTSVESFDNLDEMFAAMARNEEAANARMTPAQSRLRDDADIDRYAVSVHYGGDLVVFHEIPGIATTTLLDDEDDERELARALRIRGYLFAKSFSAWEPSGEVGDVHASAVEPVSREAFELARELGWPSMPEMRDRSNAAYRLYLVIRRDVYEYGR